MLHRSQTLFHCLLLTGGLAAPVWAEPVAHDDHAHHGAQVDLAKVAKVVHFYEQRVASEPQDLVAWSKLGPLYLDRGRSTGTHETFLQAEHAFAQVQALRPESAHAALGIAYARLGRHAFQPALQSARQAARLNPDLPAVTALLGDIHFAVGNYVEAQWAFENLLRSDPSLQAHARLGLMHQLRGHFDDARARFEAALELGRSAHVSPADLAWCEAMLGDLDAQVGQPEAALARYRSALELDPLGRSAILGMAQILHQQGKAMEALPHLQRLVEHAPEPKHWLALAQAMTHPSQARQAHALRQLAERTMLEEAARGETGHLRELVLYWFTLAEAHPRELELALLDLGERRDVDALMVAAWAQFRIGQVESAAELAREAMAYGGATSEHQAWNQAIQGAHLERRTEALGRLAK